MTFEEFGKLPLTEESEMLLQAVAILSTQGRFQSMSPSEVFDFVAKQAVEVRAA